MLHIVTPLFQYDLVDQVYRSIPVGDDVRWHLAKTSRRPPLPYDWIHRDPRIRLHEIDCDDTDIVAKRNAVFDQIADGYFYLLDDDTICLDEMYRVYREYSSAGFVGMIVGGNDLNGTIAPSANPALNRLDTGVVICHHAVLGVVRWEWAAGYARDRLFWSRCFQFFGPENTVVLDRTIATYNRLGPRVRVRKRVLSMSIVWDIYNPVVARCYLLVAGAKHHWRRYVMRR